MTCALTERTVQAIVTDLETDGYLRRVRDGRRNRYEISDNALFRHPAEAGVQVAGLLALLAGAPTPRQTEAGTVSQAGSQAGAEAGSQAGAEAGVGVGG